MSSRYALPHQSFVLERDQTLVAFFVLTVALFAVTERTPLSRENVTFAFKPTHLVPAIVQGLIFAYWSVHWAGVRPQLAWIPVQIAFAYGCDACVALLRTGRWTVGFGPIPIVLSINLFLWFEGRWFFLSYALAALAVVSRVLIQRADKRHVFNPSALAIGVFGVAAFAFPDTYVDFSNYYSFAPNMWETLFLVSLVPLARFELLPMTIAAVWAIGLPFREGPNPWQPAFFLALTLFAGDPATVPRTPAGRVLSGLALGVLVALTSHVLVMTHQRDFFSKVWPVVAVNVLALHFDRWALRLPAWFARVTDKRHRLAHVVVWTLFLVRPSSLGEIKASHTFRPGIVAHYDLPLLVREPDDSVVAEHNPVYCRPFSYLLEWRLWRAARRRPSPSVW